MTTLQVRRPPFAFDGDVPFLWNAERPEFSLMMNSISFGAIAFEKYIVAAMRQAIPFITEPAVAAEADAFLRQEAQHAAAHRAHVKALSRTYPGLRATLGQAIACYDDLLTTRPLGYHLAYVANLEATFTPAFKLLLDYEEELFKPGDERVASLFLWHFVEEIEHRGSALLVYRAVVGREAYRLAVLPSIVRHLARVSRVIAEGFDAHVPFDDRKVKARALGALNILPVFSPFLCAPLSERRAATWSMLKSQVPNHDPEHQPLPRFADLWLERYARGADVTRWYSSMTTRASGGSAA